MIPDFTTSIYAVPRDFVRVGSPQPTRLAEFVNTDTPDNFKVQVRQDVSKQRKRHEVRLTQEIIAADPVTGANVPKSASAIIVFDEPLLGWPDDDMLLLGDAVISWLTANSKANGKRLLRGEL